MRFEVRGSSQADSLALSKLWREAEDHPTCVKELVMVREMLWGEVADAIEELCEEPK